MNEKLVDFLIDKTDQLGAFIDELAKQMGVAARHVYVVLIKQQYVEGIGKLIWSVPFAIVLFIAAFFLIRADVKGKFDSELAGMGFVFGGICTIGAFILLGNPVKTGIMQILNPEFYAIDELMNMVEGLVDDND